MRPVNAADEALLRSFELGMDDDGWTDAVMEEVDGLLPVLIEAGYARIDSTSGELYTWSYTTEGVARYDQLLAIAQDRVSDKSLE
jgi:hypothetical protein